MQVTIVFLTIFAAALANPLQQIASPGFSHYVDNVGQYALRYQTDHTAHVEQGALKRLNGAVVLVKKGSYEYIGADGKRYRTSYIADENGFRAFGDHIPVPAVV